MLRELYIENLAVIRKENIRFCKGLNVFTGETGAGKSILINGINAILGQRAARDVVRTGEKRAVVSAVFEELPEELHILLSRLGLEPEDDTLTLTREIYADGKSVARVNLRTVSASVLREIGELLVNIHGQHDSQILLNSEKHLQILDDYAQLGEQAADYHAVFKALQETARQLKQAKNQSEQQSARAAQLREILREISALELEEDEDIAVEEEFQILTNAAELAFAAKQAAVLTGGNDETEGASVLAAKAQTALETVSGLMPKLDEQTERLISAVIELNDIASELESAAAHIDLDQRALERVSARRDVLIKIKKKYGPELADVLKTQENAQQELSAITSGSTDIAALEQQKKDLLHKATVQAKALSEKRVQAGKRFAKQVAEELAFLNMKDVQIVVSMEQGKLTQAGMDSVEFLISANAGETPKPLAKIASGGELSRIMLALKSVTAARDNIGTMIFDEIDTGVSGRAAQKIGQKLHEIAGYRQVLCVTHLAQIAVMADQHILIEKHTEQGRTLTEVQPLDFAGRKLELARIMGGEHNTELMLKNAEELLLSVHGNSILDPLPNQ